MRLREACHGKKKFLLLLVFALELISYLHDNNFPQATRGGAYSTNSLGDSKKARRKGKKPHG